MICNGPLDNSRSLVSLNRGLPGSAVYDLDTVRHQVPPLVFPTMLSGNFSHWPVIGLNASVVPATGRHYRLSGISAPSILAVNPAKAEVFYFHKFLDAVVGTFTTEPRLFDSTKRRNFV